MYGCREDDGGCVKEVMTNERAIKVILNEIKCVERNVSGCDRCCETCDLVLPDKDVLEAYRTAIEALKGDDRR